MFLRRIKINGFLSFGRPAELSLGAGLTVVTGPNAAGKSNIGRCLDLARAVLAAHGSPEAGNQSHPLLICGVSVLASGW